MATLLPEGKQSFTDGAGKPLVGGKLYTYDAGTSTPRPTYADAAGTVQNTNPVVLDARGEAIIFWKGVYKVVLKDSWGNTIWSIDGVATTDPSNTTSDMIGYEEDTVQAVLDNAKPMEDYTALRAYTGRATGVRITQAGLAGCFQRDDADATSVDNGGTIIVDGAGRRWKRNYTGPVHLQWFGIDRSGSSFSTAAVQAAIDMVKQTGGVVEVPTGTITIAQLDLTGINSRSVTLRGQSIRDTVFSVKASGGVGFDCTGSQFLNFEDFSVSGDSVDTPKAAWLFARNSTNGSAGRNRLKNVQTVGYFSVAPLYNYASEEFRATNCYFTNSAIGADVAIFTRDNVASIASSFATITTGNQSTTEYNLAGCAFNNYQSSGTGRCLVLRGVSGISFTGWTFMVNGTGAYVELDANVYGAINIDFTNVMLDGPTTATRGWVVSGTQEIGSLTINNVLDYGLQSGAAGGYILYAGTGTKLSNVKLGNLQSSAYAKAHALKFCSATLPAMRLELDYSVTGCDLNVRNDMLILARSDLFAGNRVNFVNGIRSGSSTPYPSVAPLYIGEEYLQTNATAAFNVLWKANALTGAAWGPVAYQPLTGAASPAGVTTPRFRGDDYIETTNNDWYKATTGAASGWKKINN